MLDNITSINGGEVSEIPRAVRAGALGLGGEAMGAGLGQPGAGKASEALKKPPWLQGEDEEDGAKLFREVAGGRLNRQYM